MSQPSTLHTQPSALGAVSERVVLALALTLALAWLGWTALIWFRYHPHLPWRDLLPILAQVLELTRIPLDLPSLGQWLEPHYGTHRIALLRFILFLDIRLLSGQGHLFYALGWFCLALLVALYSRLASRYFLEPRSVLFTAALAGIWLFSPSHVWNLINAVNISWHLSLTCSLLGFYLLLRRPAEPRVLDWCGAYILCSLAAFSTFAGVISWLMLPLVALLVQPRALLPSLAISAVFAWLYAGGMSSDASLTAQWDAGTPEVIEKIRAQAEMALAANTPQRIIEKTLHFLAWPLAADSPRLALILSGGSVAVLAIVFGNALFSRERLHPWFTFCLVAAGLCLGIALATQFGRLMVHPNHAHGPSYERYQSVVVIYWLSISGLIMGQKARTGLGGAIILTGLLALAWTLQVPTGDYLRQEIKSAEVAAQLFDRGQLAHHFDARPRAGSRFSPEFVYSFDDLFNHRRLAYRATVESPADQNTIAPCDTPSVTLDFGAAQPFAEAGAGFAPRAVTAHFTSVRLWSLRAVALYQGQNLVGRLSPVHTGDYTPRALINPDNIRWQGIAATGEEEDLVLVTEDIMGRAALCKYTPRASL